MAKHVNVPKFGDWESDGDVPYSQVFEVVRKGRNGGKAEDPNDPHQGKPVAVHGNSEAQDPKDQPHRSSDHQLRASPLRHDPATHKHTTGSPLHRHGYQPSPGDHRRAVRTSAGSEHSMEHSPLHPRHQVKPAAKVGASSPSVSLAEGSHAYASNIAGRLRTRPGGQGDETPEKGSSVPKFGDWDESDPSSADGYTQKFNKMREEKFGTNKATMVTDDTIYANDQDVSGGSKTCCFGWCRK